MRSAALRGLNLTFVFLVPFVGAVGAAVTLALGLVTGLHVALLIIGFLVSGLGITIGYHRLATHRSFEVSPLVKAVLLACGSTAAEGAVIDWVANHVKHHEHSDDSQDPHSPLHGFWHAHCGWLMGFGDIDPERYAPFILRDPTARAISQTFPIWLAAGYIIPFLIGGWEGLIWGGFFRQFAVQNVTFAVNSVCHRFGARPFKTTDFSTNNWVIGLLGHGEGWHNNHHAFPWSALHGLRWWEFDLSGRVILAMEAIGLAWNVKRPDSQQIQRKLAHPEILPAYAHMARPRGQIRVEETVR
ncbi:MAG: Stearoyl-CoA 9-desaturase [Chloroflexi bacterium]|nr:Stearoyl-CoA 9-desaturase [Chloroflexota bacterium]